MFLSQIKFSLKREGVWEGKLSKKQKQSLSWIDKGRNMKFLAFESWTPQMSAKTLRYQRLLLSDSCMVNRWGYLIPLFGTIKQDFKILSMASFH